MNIEQIQQHVMTTKQIHIISKVKKTGAQHNDILDMSHYAGVVDYHPEELVITVKAGTTIRQIKDLLAQNGQIIPFFIDEDIATTIGAVYALGCAELRDAVLGIKIVDGQGRQLTFGGQVMKNVAGYDVSRLLVGSRGTLAVICEISFRILPNAYAVQVSKHNRVKTQNTSLVSRHIEQGLKKVFDPRAVFI